MIDGEDAEDFWLLALITDHPLGVLALLIIAVIMSLYAWDNSKECSKQHCDKGHPVLMKEECLCVESARK